MTMILHSAGVDSAQGSRATQEDHYDIVLPDQMPERLEGSLLFSAVYDGHVAMDVASHARDNFGRLILSSRHLQSGDYEKATANAVRDEDELLLEAFHQGTEIFAEAGSTLAVCLLNLTRGVLVVGNLGDSHILLGEQDPTSRGDSYKVRRLTEAHKPSNRCEQKRIEHAGGAINVESGSPRLGALNMSRGLGDLQYKTPLMNAPRCFSLEQERAGYVQGNEQGDLLSNQPYLARVPLHKDHRYILVLTTDGVTDELDDKSIMRMLAKLREQGVSADEAAKSVVAEVASRPMSDNATCVCHFIDGTEI